jgi:cytochrome o ubiquinol oxidase subunit IV
MSQDMSNAASEGDAESSAPGDERDATHKGVRGYLIGLALAATLTAISFWVAMDRSLFWQPGVTMGLLVLSMAQMGIHLVFFLHLTTGPDNANNALAVAFGLLIIALVGAGTLWIMANLNANMMPMEQMTDLHQQR